MSLPHYKALHDANFRDQSKISINVNVQLVLTEGLFVIEIVHVAYTEYSRISGMHK